MSAPSGVPRNLRNQELRLFGAKHKEVAAQTLGSIRDHIDWTKYYDPQMKRFVSKKTQFTDAAGKRHYQYLTLIKQGVIEPPSAHYFDTTSGRFVHHTSVRKDGAVLPKYAMRSIKGKVIYGADVNVSVRTILFSYMFDADGEPMKVLKAAKRADKTLAHAVDPDGYYHQEIKEFVFLTTETALKPYPLNKMWWFKGSHFADYVDWSKEHTAGNPLFQGDLFDKLSVFASGLTGMKFVQAVKHDPAEEFKRLVVPNRADNEAEHVYSPYTMARAKEGATTLEDWLLPAFEHEWDKGVAPVVGDIDLIGGCGYNIVLNTFYASFNALRNFDKGVDKRTGTRRVGKYLEVKMTHKWLYENVFHVGEPFDPDKLALSALELRRFYERYRVCLYVFDITGRIDTEASYVLPVEDVNKHLRPATTYVLQHNRHLFLLREGVKSLTQMVLNENSVLYKPLKPFERIEVDDEEAAKMPSQSYYLGNSDTPVLFIEEIGDLPTLHLHIPKRTKDGAEVLDKDGKVVEHDKVRVACPCSMWLVLSELLIKCKYEPKVSMAGGSIMSLTLKIDGIHVTISPPDCPPDDKVPYIPTEEIFRIYTAHDLALKNVLRNKETVSTYSRSLRAALVQGKTPTLFRSPLVFGSEIDDGNLMAHDMNKAYTSFVKGIKVVPVFNEFDEFEVYHYEKDFVRPLDEAVVSDPLAAEDTNSVCSNPSPPTPPLQVMPTDAEDKALLGLLTATEVVDHVVVGHLLDTEDVLTAKALLLGVRQEVVGPWLKRHRLTAKVPYALGASKVMLQPPLEFAEPAVAFDVTDKTLKQIIHNFRLDKHTDNYICAELKAQLGISKERVEPLLFTEREKNAFYLVLKTGTLFKDDPRTLLLDQEYNLLTFDTWLAVRNWDCCVTLGLIKPSKIVPVAVGKTVDNLWADPSLPVPLKKFLVNKHVGLCGKRFNKKHDTLIFTDNDEAMHYFQQLGGKEHADYYADMIGERKLYFVTRNRETPLKDGFFPIQHIVYDKQRMALYKRAVAVGKPVVAAKVDCLWFEGFDEALLVRKDNSVKGMGSWAVLKSDGHPVKDLLDKSSWDGWEWEKHLPSLINGPSVINIPIKNEMEMAEFKEVFDNANHVLILANIPGAGKTYSLVEYCRPLGDKALFVCPYNALADDLMACKCAVRCEGKCANGVTAITLHNLLGLMGGSDGDGDKKKPYDVSGVTHIIFDEVFCHPTYMLAHIRRYTNENMLMEDGTDRKFFAAGDNNQNSPIETLSLGRLERKDYYFNCVSTIFDTHITLEVCKRVSTDDQRTRLGEIKRLVLETDTPLIDIARRFFTPITDLNQVAGMSVCYLNETARIVNNFMNAKEAALIAKGDPPLVISNAGRNYWVGQTLRCRKRLQVNGERMHINYVYKVASRWEGGLVLKSSLGTAYEVSFASLAECFAYNYAHTCHSLQGMSVAEGISLHDLIFYFVTREWFYTALTRSRDLDKIYYWDPSVVLHDLQVVKEGELEIKMERKLAGYKAQDAKAGRPFEEADYVSVDDFKLLLEEQDYRCAVCAEVMALVWKDAKDNTQFTLDRLDNALAHVKGNCAVSCLGCNRGKH